jgi:ubiquinol-cytochrome c reductase cytochrome b subunit
MLRHAGCLASAAQYGSNHPLVGANPVDKSAFLTDTIIKDLVGWVLGAIGFTLFAFGAPIALGHPDNSIHANPLTTPAHIVPEWYFLALYAILRSIPNKQAGVVAVALVIFTLILLGWGSMVSKNRCVTGLVLELNGCEERHCACPIRF